MIYVYRQRNKMTIIPLWQLNQIWPQGSCLTISRSEMENCRETRPLIYGYNHTKNHSLIQDYDSKCLWDERVGSFEKPNETIFPSILSQKSGHPWEWKSVRYFSSLKKLIPRVFNRRKFKNSNPRWDFWISPSL